MLNHDVVRYARTRLLTPSFLAICGICVAFVLGFKGTVPLNEMTPVVGPMLLALVGFRLWDDLADLPLDRQVQPARVLCRTERLPLFRLIAALGVAFPLLVISTASSALTYLLYCLALAITYALTQSATAAPGPSVGRGARVAIVLLKYPFVCLAAVLASSPLDHDFALRQALLLLYAVVVVHETVSEQLRSRPASGP